MELVETSKTKVHITDQASTCLFPILFHKDLNFLLALVGSLLHWYTTDVDSVKPSALTKSRMERSNFFARRLDRTFHAFVPAANDSRCQYCYYQWSNDLDESQKEVQVFMKQNRKQTSCVELTM